MSKQSRSKANIPIHGEEVINIKVNVEAQAKRSAYPGTPGIHRQTAFCLPSSVFRLLSSVFCPIRPFCPACHEFMSQLCKTKPICRIPK